MNLFDICAFIEAPLGTGPRQANDSEVSAYLDWQRERRGLVKLPCQGLEWSGSYRRGKDERICIGATYGAQTVAAVHESGRWEGENYTPGRNTPAQWENGSYSLLMPGYAAHRATVTMETLNDAGEVQRSQTLPREPKKGGVIWSRDEVRKAHGPVEKARKARASKAPIPVETPPIPVHAEAVAVDPVEICQMEAAGSDSGPCAVAEAPEAPEALCEAVSGQDEPVTIADKLPAPEAVKDSLTTDPVAALVARVEALEAIVATLSAETGRTPIPAVQDRPKRSAAHERAIRRAWAERKARRDMLQTLTVAAANQASSNGEIMRLRDECTSWKRIAAERLTFLHRSQDKRIASVQRARRMIAAARHAATFERQRAAVLASQLAKAQEDLAGAYSETELQAAVAVERERAASLRADLEAARAEGEGRADGAGVAAAQAAAQMARAIAAEEAVAAVRADLDKERAALAAVTARNARLLQSMADLTERVERAEAAIAA